MPKVVVCESCKSQRVLQIVRAGSSTRVGDRTTDKDDTLISE